ncbi:MAG: GxxExxY protein [Bacteroidota bacterium]
MKSRLLFPEVGRRVLTAFYQVYNTLGFGFLEKVYENALANKLRKNGHYVQQQVPVKVYFEGEVIGNYFADIVVDKSVIIEVKAAEALH